MASGSWSKTDFVIPAERGTEVRGLTSHILDLFQVDVAFPSDPSTVSQTGNEWVQVSGTQDGIKSAKEYIVSVCNPDHVQYKNIPPQLLLKLRNEKHDISLVELEKQHRTHIKLVAGSGICIQGNPVSVGIIVSLLEEEITKWENGVGDMFYPYLEGTVTNNELLNENLREFGKRLGYSDTQIEVAASECGQNLNENSLLHQLLIFGGRTAPGNDTVSLERDRLLRTNCRTSADHDSKRNLETVAEPSTDSSSPSVTTESTVKLRHIVVDGSNVAMCHGNKEIFSCRGIQICVDWFRNRGHRDITVIVPQWRKEVSKTESPILDQEILLQLEKERILVFTPSRRVNGRRVVCYDDRYIVKVAAEEDGIIVSNDHFRDLEKESPEYKQVIDQRLLMYSFVNDRFMPPDDPLGRHGPSLDDFLKKGTALHPRLCPYGRRCTYGQKCRYYHPEKQNPVQKKIEVELRTHVPLRVDGEKQNQENPMRSQEVRITGEETQVRSQHGRSTLVSPQRSPKSTDKPSNTYSLDSAHRDTSPIRHRIVEGKSIQSATVPLKSCASEINQVIKETFQNNIEVVARGRENPSSRSHTDLDPVKANVRHSPERSRPWTPNDVLSEGDWVSNTGTMHRYETPYVSTGYNGTSHKDPLGTAVPERLVPSQSRSDVPLAQNGPSPFHRRDWQQRHPYLQNCLDDQARTPSFSASRIPYHPDVLHRGNPSDVRDDFPSSGWTPNEFLVIPFQPGYPPQQHSQNGFSKVPYAQPHIVPYEYDGRQYGHPRMVAVPSSNPVIIGDGMPMASYPKRLDNEYQMPFTARRIGNNMSIFQELQNRFPGQSDRILNILRQHPNENDVDRLSWIIQNRSI